MGDLAIICVAAGVPVHCTKRHSSLPSPSAMSCQRVMFSTVRFPIGSPLTHIRTRDRRWGCQASPPVRKHRGLPNDTQRQ